MRHTLQERLSYWASHTPSQPFVIEAQSGAPYTYQQTLAAITRLRQWLGNESRTLVMALPGDFLSTVVWLSALSGGHTLIPLAPDAPAEEQSRLVAHYDPDFIFVEDTAQALGLNPRGAQVIPRAAAEAVLWDERLDTTRLPETQEGAVCLHTSGSTGEPKGVILHEPQIMWAAEHIAAHHGLTPRDRGLSVLPFFHVNAPLVSLCASLVAGSTVVIAQRFSQRNFWPWIARYQVTWASIVPTILAMLLETPTPTEHPAHLRFVRTASAPLPISHLRAFEAKFTVPVIETYGLTEAASTVAANPLPPGTHKAGSVGLPLGVGLRICAPCTADETHIPPRDVSPGDVGEICIQGPSVVHAYQGNADAAAFQDGWFHTGDLGYQDADGYLFITGRRRDMINRGGENIAPREVEEVLAMHPAVRDVAVVGRPDLLYGEVVVAYVVLQHPNADAAVLALHAHASHYLSRAKVPVDYIPVTALPRTAAGKLARQQLRQAEVHS